MAKKEDLRTVKTKRNIRESFMKLARENDIQKITVKQICESAQCSRNTFYMHYPYKEALFSEIISGIVSEITEGFAPAENYALGKGGASAEIYLRSGLSAMTRLTDIFPLLPPESELFNTFRRQLTDKVVKRIEEMGIKFYASSLGKGRELSRKERNVIALMNRFMVSGIIDCGVYWMRETDYSLDEVMELLLPGYRGTMQAFEKQLLEL